MEGLALSWRGLGLCHLLHWGCLGAGWGAPGARSWLSPSSAHPPHVAGDNAAGHKARSIITLIYLMSEEKPSSFLSPERCTLGFANSWTSPFLGVCFRINLNPALLFKVLSVAFNTAFCSTKLACLSITILSPLLAAPFLCTGLTFHIPHSPRIISVFTHREWILLETKPPYWRWFRARDPGFGQQHHLNVGAALLKPDAGGTEHQLWNSSSAGGNSAFLPSLPWRITDIAIIPKARG